MTECYECARLAELVAENSQLRVKVDELTDGGGDYVSREAYEDLRDEFVWETTFLHRIAKKCGTKDVPSLVAYVEQLEAKVDELTADVSQAVEDTAERVTNKCEMLYDSREKLEADMRKWCAMMGMQPYQLDFFYGWLDRQTAITERQGREEWRKAASGEIYQAKQEAEELREKVRRQSRQLTDTQNALESRNEEIKPRWKRDTKKLEAKIDDLTAELKAARQAHAQAEYEAASLREQLEQVRRGGRMNDKWTMAVMKIVARTVLRCERHILRDSKSKTENDVLTHNDECIRLKGLMEEE